MLIQDRIRTIMKSGNHTASEFADRIGVKRSNLSHILSGRNKPSLDFLVKVIEAYPNVNASWLITGEARNNEANQKRVSSDAPSVSAKAAKDTRDLKKPAKEIEKIVIFYTDGSFDKHLPNQQ